MKYVYVCISVTDMIWYLSFVTSHRVSYTIFCGFKMIKIVNTDIFHLKLSLLSGSELDVCFNISG